MKLPSSSCRCRRRTGTARRRVAHSRLAAGNGWAPSWHQLALPVQVDADRAVLTGACPLVDEVIAGGHDVTIPGRRVNAAVIEVAEWLGGMRRILLIEHGAEDAGPIPPHAV